jgi:hypothetical protein
MRSENGERLGEVMLNLRFASFDLREAGKNLFLR